MELQANLETTFAQQNTSKYLRNWMEELGAYNLITEAVERVKTVAREKQNIAFQNAAFAKKREDLEEVYAWLLQADLEKMLWSMNVTLLESPKGVVTIQTLIGMIFHKVVLSTQHRIKQAIELVLEAFESLPYVHVQITRGQTCLFKLNFELPPEQRNVINQKGFPLPLVCPPVATSNTDIGYHTFNEHIISGSHHKQHDKYVDLNHINRKNRVAFTWENRLSSLVDFEFDPKPKLKKGTGRMETAEDINKRRETYEQLKVTLPYRVSIMVKHGNKFHLAHKYDNRLRTYAKGHEFNYQSHKFIKSSIQLAKSEPVAQEW